MDTFSLTFVLFFVFILGAIVGSFINVIVLRYNTGKSFVSGRSECFNCSQPLAWYDLVPIASFLALGGNCRYCKSKISPQYPIVEVCSGLLFVGLALRQYYYYFSIYSVFQHGLMYSVLFFLYYACIFGLLLVIAVYDMRHKIIPDVFVYTFIFLSAAKLLTYLSVVHSLTSHFTLDNILNLIAPIVLALPFALLWYFSDGMLIGFGDAKLIMGIGALLGFVYGLSAVVLSFWIGGVVSILLILYNRFFSPHVQGEEWTMRSEVPFGPFLILGTLIVFFGHIDVFHLYTFFNLIQ